MAVKQDDPVGRSWAGLPVPGWLKPALPWLPALAALAAGLYPAWGPAGGSPVRFNFENIRPGSFMLAGAYDQAVRGSMYLYDVAAAAWSNLGLGPVSFLLAAGAGALLLAYSAACLLGGRRAGLLAVAASGALVSSAGWGRDPEQVFYSFFVLLALVMTLLREREGTLKNDALAGLAIGAGLLARTPLFLFPLAVAAFDWLRPARARGLALRTLVFLASAYALLLPGALLRRELGGKFSLFDDKRAACNIITAARGSVYTMEGDYLKLAGLGKQDSPTAYFMREVAKAPAAYAAGVLRRLKAIFLFNPLVIALLLAGLAAARGREERLGFLLPVYFVLVHSLLSVESRYFQPLSWLAAPLAAAALLPRRLRGDGEPCPAALKAPVMLFWFALCLALAAAGLALAYPARAGRSADRAALDKAAAAFPRDRLLLKRSCDAALEAGDYAAYYSCLKEYGGRFDDEVVRYFLQVRDSARLAAVAESGEERRLLLIVRMLREYELGDVRAAEATLALAYGRYEAEANTLRGTPYGADAELQKQIRGDSNNFWDRYVYDTLLMWPPEGMVKILSGLAVKHELTPKLAVLRWAAENARLCGGVHACLAKRGPAFAAFSRGLLRGRAAALGRLSGLAAPRPAAAAYFAALAVDPPEGQEAALYGEGIFEEELLKLAEVRAAKTPAAALAAAAGAVSLQERPLYCALLALYTLEGGAKAVPAGDLDRLEAALAANPGLLRLLAGREAAAGRKQLAGRLEAMADAARPSLGAVYGRMSDGPALRSKKFSDQAVEKLRTRELGPAEALLRRALAEDKDNPEALMNLCYLRRLEGRKQEAYDGCRRAAESAVARQAAGETGYETLASEALFGSYGLLKELGRGDEARAALRRCVEGAPASWPRLPEARRELAAAGGRAR